MRKRGERVGEDKVSSLHPAVPGDERNSSSPIWWQAPSAAETILCSQQLITTVCGGQETLDEFLEK